jgi:hypothetical protein
MNSDGLIEYMAILYQELVEARLEAAHAKSLHLKYLGLLDKQEARHRRELDKLKDRK